MRLSLRTLAVGLWTYLTMSVVSIVFAVEASAPCDLAFIVGLTAIVIGALATGLSLVATRGPCRAVGVLFLAGLLLLVFMEVLRPYVARRTFWGLRPLRLDRSLPQRRRGGVLALEGDVRLPRRA